MKPDGKRQSKVIISNEIKKDLNSSNQEMKQNLEKGS